MDKFHHTSIMASIPSERFYSSDFIIRVFQLAGNWAQSKASETLLKAHCKSVGGMGDLWRGG